MQPGDLLDLDITDVAHGGVFVARHENRVVFVPDAIPGERMRVRLTDVGKASFWRAEAVEVLDASPHRQPHVWGAADIDTPPEERPGGADLGHIELGHQRALKQRVLEDALRRFGGIDEPHVTMRGLDGETPDGTQWRTRVSLHVDESGHIGPFAARSHRVIPVTDLPLATREIEDVARGLEGFEPGRIDLVQPADGSVRVILRPEIPRAPRPARSRGARSAPRPPRPRVDPTAHEIVTEIVGGRAFRVDAGGFWQVHRLAAEALTSVVRAAFSGDDRIDPEAQHLDLYGGVGLFAATLAELAGASAQVTSVESDARATEHAGDNLAEWVGARAETGRVDRWLAAQAASASPRERGRLRRGVVLLDPPRAGAGREVVEHIAGIAPASVVYVACDPVALARDIATFASFGYRPERIDALDLFPNSHHIETVAVLSR
ncbi:class I SAM-dependent RNA methyltransferase [uncultured Microbacterium sp.]|uniref:class I SAM-dependent RNA methyltransferase n=1 Tax=uncultured Microbacterium sp. TaxID=191216 RepID=UPI002629D2C1|nr:TRAM domain-containing protein [uncultured Microbacterium sp.]